MLPPLFFLLSGNHSPHALRYGPQESGRLSSAKASPQAKQLLLHLCMAVGEQWGPASSGVAPPATAQPCLVKRAIPLLLIAPLAPVAAKRSIRTDSVPRRMAPTGSSASGKA